MQKFRVDISSRGAPMVLYAAQGDTKSRFFSVAMFESGVEYSLPSGAYVTVRFGAPGMPAGWYDTITEPDGGSHPAISVDGHTITVELAEQAVSVPGKNGVWLLVNAADGYQLASWGFDLFVEAVHGLDAPEATVYYNALAEQVAQTFANAQAASESASAAKLYAEMAQQVSQGAVGYYATPEALRSAHATASDGNWAIVGSTDTVWVWDSDSGDWRDTSQHIDMSQYYTKSEVQTMVQGAHSNSYTITLPASGWKDGTLTFQGVACTKCNTVSVDGVTVDTRLSLPRFISGDLAAARAYVCQDTGAGTVTFWATSALAEFTVELVEVK